MTAYEPRPRSLGALTQEIREAWLVARTAVSLPQDVESTPGLLIQEIAEDPRVTSALDARHTAFEWALSEVIGGDYGITPEKVISDLLRGVIPERVPGQADGPVPVPRPYPGTPGYGPEGNHGPA